MMRMKPWAVAVFLLLVWTKDFAEATKGQRAKSAQRAEPDVKKLSLVRAKSQDSGLGPIPPQLHYGDIIGFQRDKIPCLNIKFKFMHYGVYIDKLRFAEYGQTPEDNLFHITGPIREGKKIKKVSDCVFGKITDEIKSTMRIHNYLDEFDSLKRIKIGSENEITERIEHVIKNCKAWRPLKNNCEHLATYVRYGVALSLQLGQEGEGWPHRENDDGFTEEEEKEILDYMKPIFEEHKKEIQFYECLEKAKKEQKGSA